MRTPLLLSSLFERFKLRFCKTSLALSFLFVTITSSAQIKGIAPTEGEDLAAEALPVMLFQNYEGLVPFVLDASDEELRLIEPTSPILGQPLVTYIRSKQSTPDSILGEITQSFDAFQKEITVSSLAYFNTIFPGLTEYCLKENLAANRPTDSMLTEVDVSSIPLEVLVPFHKAYRDYLFDAEQYFYTVGAAAAADSALLLANAFQDMRNQCPSVSLLQKTANLHKNLPKRAAHLLDISLKVSSAEAAYPRTQHVVNGFVQSIHDSLVIHPDLKGLLHSAYNAEKEWLANAATAKPTDSFFDHVEKRVMEAGYGARDALLVLCYSTRNMPNIDVQYARNPYQAIALETYFWKMRELQIQAVEKHFEFIFPNHEFESNPMLYHYATASYLSYVVRKEGYSSFFSVSMACASKAGYKLHKFMHASDIRLFQKKGLKRMAELFKKQGTFKGIMAGYYGGKHGVKIANAEKRRLMALRQTTK